MTSSRNLFRLPPAVLHIWGVLFGYLWLGGHLRVLLNPLFWPLTIGSAFAFLIMGLAYFLLFRAPAQATTLGGKIFLQAGVLLVPLTVAVLNLPASLSAQALQARSALSGGRVLARMAAMAPVNAATPALVDFATAAFYPEHIPSVSNKTVEYVGQYLPSSVPGDYRFCRVLISCCAADATPVYLHIVGPVPAATTSMEWIQVKGTSYFRQDDGEWIPCVKLISVKKVPAPPDPFLYAIRMGKVPSG